MEAIISERDRHQRIVDACNTVLDILGKADKLQTFKTPAQIKRGNSTSGRYSPPRTLEAVPPDPTPPPPARRSRLTKAEGLTVIEAFREVIAKLTTVFTNTQVRYAAIKRFPLMEVKINNATGLTLGTLAKRGEIALVNKAGRNWEYVKKLDTPQSTFDAIKAEIPRKEDA